MVHFPTGALALVASVLPQLYVLIYYPHEQSSNIQNSQNRTQASGLDTATVAAGMVYFRTATDNPELTDTAYVTQLNNTDDFGQITPGNSQKVLNDIVHGLETYLQYFQWDATEPTPNTFTFTEGDAIADLAEANGQKLRCHNLVWHEQLPSWGKLRVLCLLFFLITLFSL